MGYDIYGFGSQSRIRSVCDRFAEAGFLVILPDFFRGQQWSKQRMEAEGRPGLVKWVKQFKWRRSGGEEDDGGARADGGGLEGDFRAAVAYLRANLPAGAKVGCAGFCWGAWIAVRGSIIGTLSAAYSAHPSVHVENQHGGSDVALASQVKCPQLFHTAGSDNANLKTGGEFIAQLAKLPFGAAVRPPVA